MAFCQCFSDLPVEGELEEVVAAVDSVDPEAETEVNEPVFVNVRVLKLESRLYVPTSFAPVDRSRR